MLSNPNAVVRRRKDSTGSELVRRRLIAVVDTLLYTAKVVFFGIFLIAEYIFLSLECMYSCSLIMRPAFEKRLRICLGLSKYHYTCCCTKIKENHQASQEQFYTPGAQAWWRRWFFLQHEETPVRDRIGRSRCSPNSERLESTNEFKYSVYLVLNDYQTMWEYQQNG